MNLPNLSTSLPSAQKRNKKELRYSLQIFPFFPMNMSVNMGRPYSFTNGNWQSSSSSGQAIVLNWKEQDFEQLTLQ